MERSTAADLLDNLIGMVDDTQGNDYDAALKMAVKELRLVECGKCKHYNNIEWRCYYHGSICFKPNGFCPYGELRKDLKRQVERPAFLNDRFSSFFINESDRCSKSVCDLCNFFWSERSTLKLAVEILFALTKPPCKFGSCYFFYSHAGIYILHHCHSESPSFPIP